MIARLIACEMIRRLNLVRIEYHPVPSHCITGPIKGLAVRAGECEVLQVPTERFGNLSN
jgi:hypothetical protein